MPWLGFSFRKPDGAGNGGGSTIESPPRPTPSAPASASASAAGSSNGKATSAPRFRMLSAEEMQALEGDNAQLRVLMKELAEKAQKQQQAQQAAAAASVGPSFIAANAGAATPHPASNPHAASGSTAPGASASGSSCVTFHKVPGLSSRLMSSSPDAAAAASAPPAEGAAAGAGSRRGSASLTDAAIAPVADFYSSLRASLRPAQAATAGGSTITLQKPKSTPAAVAEEEEDEWERDAAPSSVAPSAAAAAAPSGSAAARPEDEALVHTKRTAIVVHKKPFARKLDSDDDPTGASTAAPKASGDFDEFGDDEFGTAVAAPSAAAEPSRGDGDEGEEVAIMDLADAEWWQVVDHPDRVGEELQAAPPPPVDPQEDEDGYVVVKNKDSLSALSEFIAQMMLKHPEINTLSPEQLREMLEGSIGGLKEPGPIGKMWQYGRSAYTVYGWSSCAYSLYKDTTYVRMAAAGIIKAATWAIVFLL